MNGARRFLGLLALLAGEAGAVALLHRLGGLPWLHVGWDDPRRWLASVPAEDAVMAALRLVALAGAYWLLVTTLCYVTARAAGLPAAVRTVEWATLPGVRRVADGAVAAVLVGSSAALGGMPAVALAAPPALVSAEAAEGIVLPPALSGPGAVPALDRAGEPPGATPAPVTHVVVAGDNLWAIAAADLGASASLAEIHARWREVVEANRDRLRSGDPDLIHPGEHVVLPAHDPPAG